MDIDKLVEAIIVQAAKDYRWALKVLEKNPDYKKAQWVAEECEQFFRGEWFAFLTDADPETIINEIRSSVNGNGKRKHTYINKETA